MFGTQETYYVYTSMALLGARKRLLLAPTLCNDSLVRNSQRRRQILLAGVPSRLGRHAFAVANSKSGEVEASRDCCQRPIMKQLLRIEARIRMLSTDERIAKINEEPDELPLPVHEASSFRIRSHGSLFTRGRDVENWHFVISTA